MRLLNRVVKTFLSALLLGYLNMDGPGGSRDGKGLRGRRGSGRWDNGLMPLGVYISVPFCRTKCSYCNFASDVFSRTVFERYTDRVCSDIERASAAANEAGDAVEHAVDSVYLGGGTPTLLDAAQLERLFVTLGRNFQLQSNAEVTVECAPGMPATCLAKSITAICMPRHSPRYGIL